MPFTLSHPAAVLLFRGNGLPVAAMVAGSMAPDVPMFVRVPGAYAATHSLRGVVTIDVVMAVLAVVVWFGAIRDPLVDLSPAAVRERLPARARYTAVQWALVPVGAALGALSHVLWDDFTHPNRWGSQHFVWLRELHGGQPGFEWAQYVSSVVGLLLCAAWAVVHLRAQPRVARAPRVGGLGSGAMGTLLVVTALVAGAAALRTNPPGIRMMLGHAAVTGTFTLGFGLLALALVWQVRSRLKPPSRI